DYYCGKDSGSGSSWQYMF
nr:immunoglobulin light chain junction region [Macaca mulatta]MOX28555.1 immunoglobulin light chain junction region [Macaca mulatta]MOX29802.1 immunoglobulin light chain junction region [Macaca mulatta]MOX30831.1 immunoglobulin light chain junction region [Macaca mulatta]MOX32370.1 immunoglobulin light chain junction region [Macaca mulatta]